MSTPSPVGRREFFALEAGEYLERLALLVAGGDAPDGDSLVRYARALRGAALMAGPPGYAVAAAALEHAAKALRDGSVTWSPTLAEQLRATVEAGKHLLRRVREWSEEDIARCERAAAVLVGGVGGRGRRSPSAVGQPLTAPTQSAAVRAYVARETAALAATLEQAAAAVEHSDSDRLTTVVQRLQPLRGLGALPGLTPLPELLEALDLTLAHGGRSGAWPPAAGRAFRATAAALARLARDIAELGRPHPDSPEMLEAAEFLRVAFSGEQDVIPVASLFLEGDAEPIVRRGAAPVREPFATELPVELVSLADRLRHAALQLRGSPPGPARALQLHALVFSLRGLVLSPPVSGTAGNLLCRLDRETMAGRALAHAEPLAELLERAAGALADAAETGAVTTLGAVLAPLCEELDRMAPAVIPSAPVVIPSEARDHQPDIVPIEALAPEPAIVPIESLAYDAAPAYTPFEQTFSTYYRLLHAETPVTGHGSPVTGVPLTNPEAVPIQALLLRGRRALERADLVRRELDAALRAQQGLTGLEALLAELLDLVPLALDDQA